MTAETPSTPATSGASPAPAKKRNLVPILIVVGVVVLIVIAFGVYKLTSDSDSGPTGAAPPKLAKDLYKAWQDGDRTAAAKSADTAAVTQIFKIPANEGTDLTFAGCVKAGALQLPKACSFTRPGGQLTMTVAKVGDARTVTAVVLGPTATTPTG
jgi:hypothetical protein